MSASVQTTNSSTTQPPQRKTAACSSAATASNSSSEAQQRPRSGSVEFLLAAAAVAQRKESGEWPAMDPETLGTLGVSWDGQQRVRLNSIASSQTSDGGGPGTRSQRLESWGGMSDLSGGWLNVDVGSGARSRLNSLVLDTGVSGAILDPDSMIDNEDVAKGVVASMGDVLEELAGAVETVVDDIGFFRKNKAEHFKKEESSNGTACGNRPRSLSTASSTGRLSVDLDAIQAALDAGEEAESMGLFFKPLELTGSVLELNSQSGSAKSSSTKSNSSTQQRNTTTMRFHKRTGLPLKRRDRSESQQSSESKRSSDSKRSQSSMPLKKRARRDEPKTGTTTPKPCSVPSTVKTPKISNATKRKVALASKPAPVPSAKHKNSADQKWENMYQALLGFAASQGPSWNGNVPTNYVTPDEIKLGRWVNNQRTSHQKGSLKPERTDRLVATGLKWNVMPANSWQGMFQELENYAQACRKANDGVWNGNVPTTYQIPKNKMDMNGDDDDRRNLGRWVNRQRSAYSAGKLKAERRAKLEELGLKWSMLTVPSWDSMYAALCDHVKQRKNTWDGTVPTNTKDNEQRPLGKWVTKQLKAMEAQKLKPNQVELLHKVGLKCRNSSSSADIVERACEEAAQAMAATSSATPDMVTSGDTKVGNEDKDKAPMKAEEDDGNPNTTEKIGAEAITETRA